jgi:hypothetical protein
MASILATFDISRRAEDVGIELERYTTGHIMSVPCLQFAKTAVCYIHPSTDLRSLSNV